MMNIKAHMEHVAAEIKKIEEFAADLSGREWWDDYSEQVRKKLEKVQKYAKANNVPVIIDVEDILERNYEGDRNPDESSEYYEEESSSW